MPKTRAIPRVSAQAKGGSTYDILNPSAHNEMIALSDKRRLSMIQINRAGLRVLESRLAPDRWPLSAYHRAMFPIEHHFDATLITAIDDGSAPFGAGCDR
jgi:hypothetical protein